MACVFFLFKIELNQLIYGLWCLFHGVIRSDNGSWVLGFLGRLGYVAVPHTELEALQRALNLAWDVGIRKLISNSRLQVGCWFGLQGGWYLPLTCYFGGRILLWTNFNATTSISNWQSHTTHFQEDLNVRTDLSKHQSWNTSLFLVLWIVKLINKHVKIQFH